MDIKLYRCDKIKNIHFVLACLEWEDQRIIGTNERVCSQEHNCMSSYMLYS